MHVGTSTAHTDKKIDYFCRKQKYSINTQAVVGGDLIFFDVTTGFLGSIHDSRLFKQRDR